MNQQNDSSNSTVTVFEVSHSFEEIAFLKQENISLLAKATSLAQKLLELEKENKHLKELLSSAVPALLDEKDEKPVIKEESAQEMICKMQIQLLLSQSGQRPLTLEETKKFDLLVKNLVLLTEKPKEKNPIIDVTPSTRRLTDKHLVDALVQIAGKALEGPMIEEPRPTNKENS